LEPAVAITDGRYVLLGREIVGYTHDASLSHDVIYHELTHALLYGLGILPGGPKNEAGAIHEGLADYFAAALTGAPAIGEWEYLRSPAGVTRVDQPAPPWDVDHFDRVSYGGAPPGTGWANGMILSSALWDLRGRIDAAADSLVLESLAYLPTVPTWGQLANALL